MKTLVRMSIIAAVLMGGAAGAHHSAAPFDQTKVVMLVGTVKSFSYINPHSWIALEAAVDGVGELRRWDVEATAPGVLARMGINADTLKPGEQVTVAVRPLRDGRRAGSMIYITKADGHTFGANPADLKAPAP